MSKDVQRTGDAAEVANDSSRREFLRKSAAGMGAAVAAGASAGAFSVEQKDVADVKIPSIRIATDFTTTFHGHPALLLPVVSPF